MVDRIEHGQGRPEDLDLLNSVADNIQGRTICALGDAAAMPVRAMHQALPRRVRVPHRAQALPGAGGYSTPRARARAATADDATTMIEIEIDGKKVEVAEGSMVMHAADKARHLHPALLLSQEALDRGQLPHVPGRGREGAQAAAGLRHAGHRRHES